MCTGNSKGSNNPQSYVDVETTNDKSSGLEKVIVILGPCLFRLFGVQSIPRLIEAVGFVDDCKLLHDVVVKSVEHDEDDTTPGRKGKKPMFCKAVWLQLPILESTNVILIFLSIAIKRR